MGAHVISPSVRTQARAKQVIDERAPRLPIRTSRTPTGRDVFSSGDASRIQLAYAGGADAYLPYSTLNPTRQATDRRRLNTRVSAWRLRGSIMSSSLPASYFSTFSPRTWYMNPGLGACRCLRCLIPHPSSLAQGPGNSDRAIDWVGHPPPPTLHHLPPAHSIS